MLRDVTERRNLEREIQEISEREQRRLGQDLHDGLGQSLTGIAFLAKVLQQKLSAKGMEESEAAGNIAALINEALAETRRLSRGLCPVILDGNDIEAALEQLAENVRSMFGVACELDCEGEIKIADNTVAMHLYRIAQEAATNAIKHGQAKSIILSLTVGKSRLILKVKDDGVGFAPKTAKGKGMGLRVMQHRCRMIGATLSLRAPKEGGVTVICSLPKGQALQKSGGRAEKLLRPMLPPRLSAECPDVNGLLFFSAEGQNEGAMITVGSRVRTWLVCLALAAAVGVAFWPALRCGFINFDDGVYVTENPHVLGGLTWAGIKWAFTATNGGYWLPLAWLSHMADVQLFDLRPSGHHLMNLLWHAANSVLLFLFLKRATGAFWRSAVAAALFALHPLRVESVVWVAERKERPLRIFLDHHVVGLRALCRGARRPRAKREDFLHGGIG